MEEGGSRLIQGNMRAFFCRDLQNPLNPIQDSQFPGEIRSRDLLYTRQESVVTSHINVFSETEIW
jgi:hypothetical protein